ncbi:MAG: hypothetical protein AVDCRST_MAG93-9360 [uncultured Chloroflexia bacterium]|uniref:Uncharacterized protein n=1 Tax=uncultured Chloroflexia bacterium TaxID=1672391 RepID=A0A6J4NFZ9_9CHLR|nr:MAG: hypothetical protein AVDCRST_MAG93-9360 [uncultured Chloroflexia bacterium]
MLNLIRQDTLRTWGAKTMPMNAPGDFSFLPHLPEVEQVRLHHPAALEQRRPERDDVMFAWLRCTSCSMRSHHMEEDYAHDWSARFRDQPVVVSAMCS